MVANQSMHVPSSKLIRLITVPDGADIADDKIVEMLAPGDVVITGDIPLAARVVENSAIAIGVHGELFDENSVAPLLPSRASASALGAILKRCDPLRSPSRCGKTFKYIADRENYMKPQSA